MDNESRQIRVAFFGQSGAGKTTLVSSFYGLQQRHSFEKLHGYRLSAPDARDGNLLLKNYYGMQDGRFPPATSAKDHTYRFEFKLSGLPQAAFLIDWMDYPGGWWDEEPADPEEKERKKSCILKLLHAQVGFLLLDGAEYRANRTLYLRTTLDHFKNAVRGWQDVIQQVQGQRLPVIEEWVIVLAKADLLGPEFTAEALCKEIVSVAQEQLDGLAAALYGRPEGDGDKAEIRTFGTKFLLASSAEVDRSDPKRVLSVENSIGLDLIAPAAFASSLERVARDHAQQDPRRNLPWWQRGLLAVAEIFTAGNPERAVPSRYRPLMLLLRAIGAVVKFDAQQRTEELRAEQRRFAKEGKLMEAAVMALRAELESDEARRCFHRSQHG